MIDNFEFQPLLMKSFYSLFKPKFKCYFDLYAYFRICIYTSKYRAFLLKMCFLFFHPRTFCFQGSF